VIDECEVRETLIAGEKLLRFPRLYSTIIVKDKSDYRNYVDLEVMRIDKESAVKLSKRYSFWNLHRIDGNGWSPRSITFVGLPSTRNRLTGSPKNIQI
jgi:hypothetical protein